MSTHTQMKNIFALYAVNFFDSSITSVKVFDQYEVKISEINESIKQFLVEQVKQHDPDCTDYIVEDDDIVVGQLLKWNPESFYDSKDQFLELRPNIVMCLDVTHDECELFFVTHESVSV